MRCSTWVLSTCLTLAPLAGAAGAQVAEDKPRRRAPEPTPVTAAPDAAAAPTFSADGMYVRRPGEPEKGTFLGLSTSPAQPALQKQLQLKPGVGLVVDGVDPGSPAEQAGVKEFDILHKLDDQILVNQEQLAVLVRTYEPGKEVALTVIREGKPQQLKAKLAERELPLTRLYFTERQTPTVELGLLDFARGRDDAIQFVTRANLVEARGDVVEMRSPDGGHTLRATQITIEDDRNKLIVGSRNGRKHLRVEDRVGKVLFEGPIETKEELERIPADLRQTYTDILLDHASGIEAPAVPQAPQPAPTRPDPRRPGQPAPALPPAAEPKAE